MHRKLCVTMLINNSHSLCLCPPLIFLITFIALPHIPFHSQSSLFLSFLSLLSQSSLFISSLSILSQPFWNLISLVNRVLYRRTFQVKQSKVVWTNGLPFVNIQILSIEVIPAKNYIFIECYSLCVGVPMLSVSLSI